MKKCLQNQSITFKDAVINPYDYDPPREGNVFASLTLILIGAVIGMFAMAGIHSCAPAAQPSAGLTVNRMACYMCHHPILDTAAKYAEYHRPKAKLKVRTPDLRELVTP